MKLISQPVEHSLTYNLLLFWRYGWKLKNHQRTQQTSLEARYSTPLATWRPNETRSLYVNCLPSVVPFERSGCWYPEKPDGLRSRRKSRRLPYGANSTITKSGPEKLIKGETFSLKAPSSNHPTTIHTFWNHTYTHTHKYTYIHMYTYTYIHINIISEKGSWRGSI